MMRHHQQLIVENTPTPYHSNSNSSTLDWNSVKGKLYDRSSQLEQLLHSYQQRTSNNVSDEAKQQHELVLITGPAGGGKTSLALTLKEQAERDGGFFCRGKFNQLTHLGTAERPSCITDIAHGPFATAISQWASLKAKRGGADSIELLQATLARVLDDSELLILVRSIPALRQITKKSLAAASWLGLQGPDAEMRYNEIFSKFIGAICSKHQPLILLLDDLQWADSSSLELLKTLLTSHNTVDTTGLLILCTVRSNRNDHNFAKNQIFSSSPPLSGALTELTNTGVAIRQIHVSNFSEVTVSVLVSDLLQLTVEETLSLSQAIYQQTNGNAFFVFQLLKFLEGEGHLNNGIDGDNSYKNEYALEAFIQIPSVHDLVAMKIKQMPSKVQEVLKIAACMGSMVSERLLTEVCSVGLTPLAVTPALNVAHEQGLVVYDQAYGTVSFVHDVIQQAVYSLIEEKARAPLHLHIGRALWIWLRSEELDTHLFFVTNQITHGLHLLDDQIENEDLAGLFLRAGQKAATSSAFSHASDYYEAGIRLLRKRHWKHQYHLSLDLYNAAAEMEYYRGNLARVDSLITSILKHGKSLDDKLHAYYTQIYSLGSRDDMQQALATGLEVLKQLGVTFPEKLCKIRARFAGYSCLGRLRGLSNDSIMNLPIMHNKRQLMAMRLMNTLFIPAYSARPELVVPMVTRMVDHTLRHGISGASCIGFGHLGYHMGRRGHTEEGYRFVRLGMRIMERFDAKEWHSRLAQALYGEFYTMRHPVRESITPLLAAHRAGLVVGDIHSSLVCASFQCRASLCASVPLPDLIDSIRKYRKICMQYGQNSADMILSHQEQLCLNFMGRAQDPVTLTGEVINEEETMRFLQGKHPYALTWLLLMKHMLAVYFIEPLEAKKIATHFRTMQVDVVLQVSLVTHLFLEGMTAAMLSKTEKNKIWQAQRICKQVSAYKNTSSENFTNKICLLEAEIAAVKGEVSIALLKYQESIDAAHREGFFHEQALACERAGYALLEWGNVAIGRDFLTQACLLYKQWGALAKVVQIQQRFYTLFNETDLGDL